MLETHDRWNWWKISDQVQEAHAGAYEKNMTNALSKLCRFVFVFLAFLLTCSVCYRMWCLKCETWQWNLRPCNEWCMLVRTKEKWPTGHGRCADLFVVFFVCFLTCSVCLLWNSVHVNRERCEERRSDKRCMKKMQKQMHEYRICTRSCMEKYVSEKLCRIPYHVEYTWHAVAWCCFGKTAC